ncbi:hypothetical protein [Fusobacterium periodonticum]|jgi:hypothetical protein|uniref:Uncharacterized protein n=1 Tax=Fusobacterium periodonticum D10 TaxID=620833 RepID=K1HDB7_9FUSO|nr:hypothetical protein [Fusobacterium periodonticum]EKA93468.1 hypothetical protein FPOG_00258 [Fusobacterium periodonticum D10]DAN38474.1 MAG TPA: hypothetical protein [Caudoviricetes sp.]
MIKAKPRKKNIVKVNEKQEIKITRQPTSEQLEESKLAFTLLNITLICRNHKNIWDNEIKNHDGYIRFDKLMMICKIRSLANKIFDANFQADEEEENVKDNFFYNNILVEQVNRSITGVGENPLVTIDDKIQRLPGGFIGTLGSLARMVKDLVRLKGVIKSLGIEKDIKKLINTSEKYLAWVYNEITFNELL